MYTTNLSGNYPINEDAVEVLKDGTSLSNSTLIDCLDSPVKILEITYGNKQPTKQKPNDSCYTSQSYIDYVQCNNDVSNVTL